MVANGLPLLLKTLVDISEKVVTMKENGKEDDSDDEAEDDNDKKDEEEDDDKEATAANAKALEKLVDEDDDESDDGEWDFEDDVDEDEVEMGDDKDEITFLKETLQRLNTESPDTIGILFSQTENPDERLKIVFAKNDAIIEKVKKELRDAVDVVDTMLKNATGQGLQDTAHS